MPTIAAQISQQLAEDIISGVLPPGEKLEEPALAQRFQVSRTPVREALRLLDARGLIELVPRRGGVVINTSPEQLVDMLEALCELDALLNQLNPKARAAFLLAHLDGYTYLEIATRLDVSERMVKKYMAQAMLHCLTAGQAPGAGTP